MNELKNLVKALADMHGHSLTLPNLRAILEAMERIEPIDRSNNFERYLDEVKERIYRLERDG